MLSGILFLMGCSIIIIMLYCTDISNSYPCLILVSWGPLCFLLPIHLPPYSSRKWDGMERQVYHGQEISDTADWMEGSILIFAWSLLEI